MEGHVQVKEGQVTVMEGHGLGGRSIEMTHLLRGRARPGRSSEGKLRILA